MDSVIIAHVHNPCYVADAGKLRRKDSGCIRFFHTHLIPLFLMMNHCHGYFPVCLSSAILAIAKGFHFEYRYITVCYQQNQKDLAVISQTFQRNTLAKERKAAPRNELKPDTGVDNRTRSN